MTTAERVCREALGLSITERELLIDRLAATLSPNETVDDAAFLAEMQRRDEEMDASNIPGMTWEQLRQHWRGCR